MQSTLKKQEVEDGVQALAWWQRTCGKRKRDDLQRTFHGKFPDYLLRRLVPLPAVGIDAFKFDAISPDEFSSMAIRLKASTLQVSSSLKKAVNEEWLRRHVTHMHSEAPHSIGGSTFGRGGPHSIGGAAFFRRQRMPSEAPHANKRSCKRMQHLVFH